jgi:hypothetical protein
MGGQYQHASSREESSLWMRMRATAIRTLKKRVSLFIKIFPEEACPI